jgi:predicted nucleic acid-binding protein
VLVVDASVLVAMCLAHDGWLIFGEENLVAPPLAFSEACSALHEAQWRGDLPPDVARTATKRIAESPIVMRALDDPVLAWEVADGLGWAKTYDAEYVALARTLGCRLVTLDERLKRGAGRLVGAIGPSEF